MVDLEISITLNGLILLAISTAWFLLSWRGIQWKNDKYPGGRLEFIIRLLSGCGIYFGPMFMAASLANSPSSSILFIGLLWMGGWTMILTYVVLKMLLTPARAHRA